jgi:hypothetical protein
MAGLANDTECPINVPGFVHHGNCDLLCGPVSWIDLTIFFLGNYAAHAATVLSQPGEAPLRTAVVMVTALLFPGAGVLRGAQALVRLAILAPTELQRAARAGALRMVVKVASDELTSVRDETENISPDQDVEKQGGSNLHTEVTRGTTSVRFLPQKGSDT